MATQGPQSPAFTEFTDRNGGRPWETGGSGYQVSIRNGDGPEFASDWFENEQFGFSIPSTRTIQQITCTVELRKLWSGTSAQVAEVRLLVGGVAFGADLGGSENIGLSFTTFTFVATSGLPSVAQVNDSGFGFAFAVLAVEPPDTVWTETIQARNSRITVQYSDATVVQKDVQTAISIIPATQQFSKDVTTRIAIAGDRSKDVATAISAGPSLTLTNPESGDVITSAALLVTWDHGPTVQSDYRVRVYSDSLETELVYDSGIVGSTEEQHQIPAGALPTGNLWIRVETHDANQMTARSALVDFSASFPTSVDVTGVTATAIGGCNDPLVLPGVKVTWDEVTPGAGETFVRYEVRRRKVGETTYTTITHIEDVTTTVYKDYAVQPSQSYEYAVVWVATAGASTLISAEQATPAREGVVFDFSFLHSLSDPTKFLRLEHWEAVIELMQPVDVFEPWGREAGTAYTGEQFSHQIAIPMHGQQRKKRQVWEKLEELARQQRSGDVLCLRLGRDRERYFVVMRRPRKQVRQKTYEPSVELVEVGFDEAVTA